MKKFLLMVIGISICVLLPFSCCIDAEPPDTSVTLTWTATGDDNNIGIAAEYDLRWAYDSTALIMDWSGCHQITGLPSPQPAGMTEIFTVEGLPADTVLFFAIKTADEAGNWSQISNIARVRTPDVTHPAAIMDLRIYE